MAVALKDIKELRELTGAGLADVKKALEEANGDKEEAIKAIRMAGQKALSKREDRSTANGLVMAKVSEKDGHQEGVMFELCSETDFVAKSPKFVEAAEKIMEAVLASDATDKETLAAVAAGETTVQGIVDDAGALFREHIVLGRFVRLTGDHVSVYLHYSNADLPPQVGVLVATDQAAAAVGHDVALHIAAYAPDYLDRDAVPVEAVEKERATLAEMTRAEGKPEKIIDKIVEGRMGSFYKQYCLLDQDFAKDPKQSVGQIVKASGGKVTDFARFHVGA